MASLGCLDLLITGGEPTIRPDFSDIIWYGRKKKFSITVKTNATKIDKYLAQLLKKAFVAEVHVSMYSLLADEHDAITGVPNSLSKTLIGIENLRDADVKVHIACPLTKINYRSVKQVKEFALKIGAKCGFDPVITAKVNGDKSPINLRLGITELDQLYKSHIYSEIIFPHLLNTSDVSSTGAATLSEQETNLPICGAGSSMVCISAYGDVIPCVALPLTAGNIREKSLKEIWTTSPVLKEVRSLTFDKFTKCIDCDKITVCTRCPGVFYSDSGSASIPSQAICLVAGYSKKATKDSLCQELNKN